jgi:hypothetical protein
MKGRLAMLTARQDMNTCMCAQLKKPTNVMMNLTLAVEEGAADQAVKLTTTLFRLEQTDKAASFVSVVEEAKPN